MRTKEIKEYMWLTRELVQSQCQTKTNALKYARRAAISHTDEKIIVYEVTYKPIKTFKASVKVSVNEN